MKIEELSGAMLDYWVACTDESWKRAHVMFPAMTLDPTFKGVRIVAYDNGESVCMLEPSNSFRQDPQVFAPSSNWAHGGPIIEADHIFLDAPHDTHYNGGPNAGWKRYVQWTATVSARTRTWLNGDDDPAKMVGGRVGRGAGETPLIAAMRAKVASHYGDEVPDTTA